MACMYAGWLISSWKIKIGMENEQNFIFLDLKII